MRLPPLWGTPASAVAFILAGCSSSTGEGESPPSRADLERIVDQARQQAADPGESVLSVPSSLAGVDTWTAYLGAGVTVVGTDKDGAKKAIVSWVLGDQDSGVSCSTENTSAESCAAVAAAIEKDMHPATSLGLSPASLHPLDEPTGADAAASCQNALSQAMADASTALGQQGGTVKPDGTTVIMCNNTDTDGVKVKAGSCWLAIPKAGGGMVGHGVSGTDFNLAKACCGAFFPMKTTQALIQGKSILVCGKF
jgi:hypothetical protein